MKNSSAIRIKQPSEMAGDLSNEATLEISGALAGTGARSYGSGNATGGSEEAARYRA
jgi:hypothetical protein